MLVLPPRATMPVASSRNARKQVLTGWKRRVRKKKTSLFCLKFGGSAPSHVRFNSRCIVPIILLNSTLICRKNLLRRKILLRLHSANLVPQKAGSHEQRSFHKRRDLGSHAKPFSLGGRKTGAKRRIRNLIINLPDRNAIRF